jgi:cyanophycinase
MTRRGVERKLARFKVEPVRPGDQLTRPKGRLLIIGGHEDKQNDKLVLRALAERVGSGKLVVATLATEEPRQAWEEYEAVFRSLGVPHVFHFEVESRAEAESVRAMTVLEGATGVFFTGGDQLKITSLIGDTPAYSRILEIFMEGGTIAGTSAGASVMTETMLVGGGGNGSHRLESNLRLAAGFGFAKDMVIDQHFAERGRIGRLLAVVGQNPRIIGIGIDENTAIELVPNRRFRVIGEGGVTVLDGRDVTYSNFADEQADRSMSLFGVRLHQLSQGDTFDVKRREPKSGAASDIDLEILGRNGNGDGHESEE